LTTYAKALSVAGVGMGLTAEQHALLLFGAVGISVLVSLYRTVRTKRAWPLGVALAGAAMILGAHFGGDVHWLEWMGVAVLLVGGLAEQLRLKRRPRLAVAVDLRELDSRR
jgi:hypothetical protein